MLRTSILFAAVLCCAGVARADDFRQRGLDALAFIDTDLRLAGGLYADHCLPGKDRSGPSTCWAAGVQLSALNAAAKLEPKRIPAARAYAEALDAYRWQKPGQPVGYQPYPVGKDVGDMFYDDNAWLVMGFLDVYKLTNDDAFLRRAQDAFAYVASGESVDLDGGVWWSDEKKLKNTCSNAPAIVAALMLYDVTHDPKLLEFAKRIYAWMPRLQDKDGLYFDGMDTRRRIVEFKWSYNSALMIRANVLLYRVTNDAKYLTEAIRIADAAEKKWFRADGALTDEASFAHLLCEALLDLNQATPRPETVKKVDRALEKLTALSRGNAYPKRWDGWRAREERIELLQTASAARAFLVAAAGHP